MGVTGVEPIVHTVLQKDHSRSFASIRGFQKTCTAAMRDTCCEYAGYETGVEAGASDSEEVRTQGSGLKSPGNETGSHTSAMHIELLEPRVAPASVLTFTDVDGDTVRIISSVGDLTGRATFGGNISWLGEQLLVLDLTDPSFQGANITTLVTKAPTGDGLVNIGRINATLVDLGNVTIKGDLGQIDAGDANHAANSPGIKLLDVRSMGRLGLATQGGAGDLTSSISGSLGALKVATDIKGATIFVEGFGTASGRIGSVTIGGSLVGDAGTSSGRIAATGDIGPVKIGRDIIGGAGDLSGFVGAIGKVASVTVGGSLMGGSGSFSGRIEFGGDMGPVSIAHDVIGVGIQSGVIYSGNGRITSVAIGGSVIGVAVGSGRIIADDGSLGVVTIRGNLVGGEGNVSGQITAGVSIGNITIGGSLVGSAGELSGLITSGGNIGAVKIGHDVKGGSGNESGKIDASGRLGPVTIGGSLIGGAGDQDTIITDGVTHFGQIFALGLIGAIKIGNNVLGDDGNASAGIQSFTGMSRVTIGGSIVGGAGLLSATIESSGDIGSVQIGHDLRGGSGGSSGRIHAFGDIPGVTVGGSVIGGEGGGGGRITAEGGAIASVRIGGDLTGGSGPSTGQVLSSRSVTIGGSLIGGTGTFSGVISSFGLNLDSVRIGHDLIGGSITGTAPDLDGSGYIESNQRIGSVFIGGSIIAGTDASTAGDLSRNASIRAGDDIATLTVKGGLIGNVGSFGDSFVIISARGQATQGARTDVAIGSISVGGRVEFAQVFAGYGTALNALNADAQIRSVNVGGDWVASSIVAGSINLGADGAIGGTGANADNINFGDFRDAKIAGGTASIRSQIGSINIAGQVFGTPNSFANLVSRFGFVAEQVGSLRIDGGTIALNPEPNNDGIILGATLNMALHEIDALIGSTAGPAPSARLVNATTLTYTDIDGDRVTVKLSRPLLNAGNVNTVFKFDNGVVGDPPGFGQQLQLIDLSALGTNGLNLTITVTPGGGDRLANIGYINSIGFDLGNVVVPGDLGQVDAGDATLSTVGIKSLSVRTIGRLDVDTQQPASATFTPQIGGEINGGIGSLTVQRDVIRANIDISGGINFLVIGGSLIGGSDLNSGTIGTFGGRIGTVKIGEHLQGGLGVNTGTLFSNVGIGSVTIGGSVIGGQGDGAGSIFGNTLGAVKIAHNFLGGTGGNAGLISSGSNTASVAIGGSIVGGAGETSARIVTDGTVGPVTLGHNLQGGPVDRSGRIEGSSLGAITIGGSIIGGSGTISGNVMSYSGNIGAVTIRHDVHGGPAEESGKIDAHGNLARLAIGGSLIGDRGDHTFQNAVVHEGQVFVGGNLGPVTIGHDVFGGDGFASGEIRSLGNIASVTIGGSLIGNAGFASGAISSEGNTGTVKIGHDILGDAGQFSGGIQVAGNLGNLTVGGSLFGGSDAQSGRIGSGNNMAAVKIGRDVLGGSADSSGWFEVGGRLTSITIGGSLIGSSASTTGAIFGGELGSISIGRNLVGGSVSGAESSIRSGYIQGDRISSVLIGGSIISGVDDSTGLLFQNGSIRAVNDVGPLTVRGSLIGNAGDGTPANFSPVIISARGQEILGPNASSDIALRQLTIGGRVEFAQILAGYAVNISAAINGNASIGAVSVGGDWLASDLVAGAQDNADAARNDFFGDADDQVGPGATAALIARIASVTIKGVVIGTGNVPGDHFGFVAEQIGSFRSLGFIARLTAGTDLPIELSPTTFDVTIREVS